MSTRFTLQGLMELIPDIEEIYTQSFSQLFFTPGKSKAQCVLGYALRQMAMVPVLVHYYQNRYEDFASIDGNEIKRIQIASFFSILGRENIALLRIIGGEDYRHVSADYFKVYAQKKLAHLFSAEQIEKYQDFIRYRGRSHRQGVEADIMNYLRGLEKISRAPKLFDGMAHFHLKHLGITNGSALLAFYKKLLKATEENAPELDIAFYMQRLNEVFNEHSIHVAVFPVRKEPGLVLTCQV